MGKTIFLFLDDEREKMLCFNEYIYLNTASIEDFLNKCFVKIEEDESGEYYYFSEGIKKGDRVKIEKVGKFYIEIREKGNWKAIILKELEGLNAGNKY